MQSEIFDREFFDKLNNLKMCLDMRLSQGMNGQRKSTAKGSSVEFSDFREYVPGDDIRRIDWNAYGRTDRLYIKQFMEEKEGRYHIFIDTSKSMEFGEKPKSKTALQIAGAFAYVILNNLDRVYIDQVRQEEIISSRGVTGSSAFAYILKELSGISFEGSVSFNNRIKHSNILSGGVAVIISDFLDKDGIDEAVRFLRYKRQSVVLIQVMAEEELNINYEGTLNITDMENDDRVKITVTGAAIKQYNKALKELKMNIKSLAAKYGAYYKFVSSSESLTQIMLSDLSDILTGK